MHICLDLDSTLIYSVFKLNEIDSLINSERYNEISKQVFLIDLVDGADIAQKGEGNLERILVIKRPHVDEFIEYITTHFDVSIWTAGQYRYARAVESLLFPPKSIHIKRYPCRLLSKDKCQIDESLFIIKDLAKQNFEIEKTIVIDDRSDTFSNNVSNAIHIPVFKPNPTIDDILRDDPTLLKLLQWFKSINFNNISDVRTLDKSKIFV